jgi:hypothetical protein
MMDNIYRHVDKIHLETYLRLITREFRMSYAELTSRSVSNNPSQGRFRYLGTAIINIITRWIMLSIQLTSLLLIGGFERYACIVKTDSYLILHYLYGAYLTINESIENHGFSNYSYKIMWQQVPGITIATLVFVVLSVVRGLTTRQGLSNTPNNISSPSTPVSLANMLDSITEDLAARTSDVTPYRIALHEFGCCVKPFTFRARGNDAFWCLHPECSLRGTWLELKRICRAGWIDESINGLPLICIRTVLWFIIVWSGYIYARTLNNEDDGGSESSPLYRLYNYIHGLTGLERRPSQIPSDTESISLYHYGTMHNESEEELQSVTVL